MRSARTARAMPLPFKPQRRHLRARPADVAAERHRESPPRTAVGVDWHVVARVRPKLGQDGTPGGTRGGTRTAESNCNRRISTRIGARYVAIRCTGGATGADGREARPRCVSVPVVAA